MFWRGLSNLQREGGRVRRETGGQGAATHPVFPPKQREKRWNLQFSDTPAREARVIARGELAE